MRLYKDIFGIQRVQHIQHVKNSPDCCHRAHKYVIFVIPWLHCGFLVSFLKKRKKKEKLKLKVWARNPSREWRRFFSREYVVLQDRWSLMAVGSEHRFLCICQFFRPLWQVFWLLYQFVIFHSTVHSIPQCGILQCIPIANTNHVR